MLDGGRFFALEVKRRETRRPSADQREYLAAVAGGGGIAAILVFKMRNGFIWRTGMIDTKYYTAINR